jgi:hypothetical protein
MGGVLFGEILFGGILFERETGASRPPDASV